MAAHARSESDKQESNLHIGRDPKHLPLVILSANIPPGYDTWRLQKKGGKYEATGATSAVPIFYYTALFYVFYAFFRQSLIFLLTQL